MERAYRYLLLIIAAVGSIWLRSVMGKFPPDKFVSGLSGVLQRFADKNPYPWYKQFLENVAIPNSQVFGWLTFLGEVFAGISLTLIAFYFIFKPAKKILIVILILGIFSGILMNLNYWLASGYMSPSIDSLNLLMLVIQLIGLIFFLKLVKK